MVQIHLQNLVGTRNKAGHEQMPETLYLSRTGMLEPLGQSQVLSYLAGISVQYRITLISFERSADLADSDHVAQTERFCSQHGIRWIRRRYRRQPRWLAPAWNLVCLFALTLRETRRLRPSLIHARSYIPAAAAWAVGRITDTPYIFDMRSLWPEELVTSGRVRRGSWLYSLIVKMERQMLKDAAAIVSLTRAGFEWLRTTHPHAINDGRVHIIPTCTDLERFLPRFDKAAGPYLFGCHGSVLTGWFNVKLLGKVFQKLAERCPDSRFEIITRERRSDVMAALNNAPGYADRLNVYSSAAADIQNSLKLHDLSLFFYAAGAASEFGRSPTRMGEALGCGIPVLTNGQIGDVTETVTKFDLGVILNQDTDPAISFAVDQALSMVRDPAITTRCREAAELVYSLETGTASYEAIYDQMLGQVA